MRKSWREGLFRCWPFNGARQIRPTGLIASLPIDAGEKEAIYLATRVPNSLVLLDDLKAREEAKALKLAVKGTIGVLVQAYRNNLVTLGEIDTIFEAIIANDDIWIASGLCREVLNQLKSESRNHKD